MKNKCIAGRIGAWAGAAALSFGFALPSEAAQTAYFLGVGEANASAWLINWQGDTSRARVVTPEGAQSGSFVKSGSLRTVTFDHPLSLISWSSELDSCNQQFSQRSDTTGITVRKLEGSASEGKSQIVTVGTLTNLDGCDAGRVVPFDDPAVTVTHLGMDARPAVADLVPGTQVAGFSEEWWGPTYVNRAADVVTLIGDGTARFATSGNVVPAAFDSNGWLVLNLGSFQRAYTRLAIDAATGGEIWLLAEGSSGNPTTVMAALVVKLGAPAGFVNRKASARMWQSGILKDTPYPFYFYLYPDGTGESVSKDPASGTESRSPISAWTLAGGKIVLTRRFGGGERDDRTWVPLVNHDDKTHFVMESRIDKHADGSTEVRIKPRINFYIDKGKAVPLAAALEEMPLAAGSDARASRSPAVGKR